MNRELIIRILSSIILVPIALFFIVKGSIFFNFFVILMFLITSYEWHFLSIKKTYYLPGFVFIIFSFYTFYFIGNQGDTGSLFHKIYFFLILITCVATDIGGYVFGKIFKGPKITKISPNKTYSGMLGGFVLSIISASLYFNNLSFLSLSESKGEMGTQIFFIVLSISFISQVGDLIISFFKRKSKLKNTGSIIPGHGGLLDRIDGMIFAYPYSFLLMKFVI